MTTPSQAVLLRDLWLDNGLHTVLEASLRADGALQLAGQDLGGPASLMNSDGEYEYWRTIAPEHLAALVALLGGRPGEDVLTLLARDWTGERSFDLETRLHRPPFPVSFSSY
jgi:hypothetical protein